MCICNGDIGQHACKAPFLGFKLFDFYNFEIFNVYYSTRYRETICDEIYYNHFELYN